MNKVLLRPQEAAAALGIGRSKLYELMAAGQLESVHIGTCRRIPRSALDSFVDELRHTSTSGTTESLSKS